MSEATSSRRRGAWGFWVPLTVSVAVATLGVAAWVISRQDNEEEAEAGLDYYDENEARNPHHDSSSGPELVDREAAEKTAAAAAERARNNGTPSPSPRHLHTQHNHEDGGRSPSWQSRMHDALARAPSPVDVGKSIVGGISAAFPAFTASLGPIREEDKSAFRDHETWSEEADAKHNRGANVNRFDSPQPQPPSQSQPRPPSQKSTPIVREAVPAPIAPVSPDTLNVRPASRMSSSSRISSSPNRKKVAIVVSADFIAANLEDPGFHEQASLLSHIPKNIDFSKTKLHILIYAPGFKDKDAAPGSSYSHTAPSTASSFCHVGPDQPQSPAGSPLMTGSSSTPAYNAIFSQALGLVENQALVLTYTTPNGHMSMLRTINPEVIYIQESLCGDRGSLISQLQTWYRYEVIVVVGAEGGSGAIADSECETEEQRSLKRKWWQDDERTGRGKGVIVVDGARLQDDWLIRTQ